MKIQWLLLAEGVGQDSRGAWTAISINQNLIVTEKLPVQTKRAVIARIVDSGADGSGYNGTLQVRFSVVSPSGRTVHANAVQLEVGPKRFADLPGTGEIPAEFGLTVQEYGTYVISVELERTDGSTDQMEEYLYVVDGIPNPPE